MICFDFFYELEVVQVIIGAYDFKPSLTLFIGNSKASLITKIILIKSKYIFIVFHTPILEAGEISINSRSFYPANESVESREGHLLSFL